MGLRFRESDMCPQNLSSSIISKECNMYEHTPVFNKDVKRGLIYEINSSEPYFNSM